MGTGDKGDGDAGDGDEADERTEDWGPSENWGLSEDRGLRARAEYGVRGMADA